MKKATLILMSLVAMTFLFSSCHHTEPDVYNPKTKLVSVTCNSPYYNFQLSYNKDKIAQIVLGKDVYSVTYDGKLITEIVGVNDDEAARLTYSDGHIAKVEYYDDGELEYFQNFDYSEGILSHISTFVAEKAIAKGKDFTHSSLFSHLFDAEDVNAAIKSTGKDFGRSLDGSISLYYDGDNIVKTVSSYNTLLGENRTTRIYVYDSNVNPYYGLPYAIAGIKAYSPNNVVSLRTVVTQTGIEIGDDLDVYLYTYNDKGYPVTMLDEDDLYMFTYTK